MFSSSYQQFTPAQITLLANSQCTKCLMLRAQLGTSADAARSYTQNRALLPRALCAATCYHPMALQSTSTLRLRTGNSRLVTTRPKRVITGGNILNRIPAAYYCCSSPITVVHWASDIVWINLFLPQRTP